MSFFGGIAFNENFLFQVFITGKQKTFGFCVQVYDNIGKTQDISLYLLSEQK